MVKEFNKSVKNNIYSNINKTPHSVCVEMFVPSQYERMV